MLYFLLDVGVFLFALVYARVSFVVASVSEAAPFGFLLKVSCRTLFMFFQCSCWLSWSVRSLFLLIGSVLLSMAHPVCMFLSVCVAAVCLSGSLIRPSTPYLALSSSLRGCR
jgi:hypothetical protein